MNSNTQIRNKESQINIFFIGAHIIFYDAIFAYIEPKWEINELNLWVSIDFLLDGWPLHQAYLSILNISSHS